MRLPVGRELLSPDHALMQRSQRSRKQRQNNGILETLARDHLLKIGLSLMEQMLSAIAILG